MESNADRQRPPDLVNAFSERLYNGEWARGLSVHDVFFRAVDSGITAGDIDKLFAAQHPNLDVPVSRILMASSNKPLQNTHAPKKLPQVIVS